MSKTEKIIWNIMDEVAFIQSVRKSVRKIKFPQGSRKATKEAIQDLFHQSISADQIIDVFDESGNEKLDISILDDRFLSRLN